MNSRAHPRHRRKRHHWRGVQEVQSRFGEVAAEAAMQHIKSDLRQEGWTEADRFPRDEADYLQMGLF